MARSGGYQTLVYTVEEVLRARSLLVHVGYSVKDYIAWSRTWPVKTAAMPHAKPTGGQTRTMTRNSLHWDATKDETVDQLVRDFFNKNEKNEKNENNTQNDTEQNKNKNTNIETNQAEPVPVLDDGMFAGQEVTIEEEDVLHPAAPKGFHVPAMGFPLHTIGDVVMKRPQDIRVLHFTIGDGRVMSHEEERDVKYVQNAVVKHCMHPKRKRVTFETDASVDGNEAEEEDDGDNTDEETHESDDALSKWHDVIYQRSTNPSIWHPACRESSFAGTFNIEKLKMYL